jgi:hypothetical protein
MCITIARQRVAKHIPATTNTSIARQRSGKHAFTTIEDAVFSVWSEPRILTRHVFSMRSVQSGYEKCSAGQEQ